MYVPLPFSGAFGQWFATIFGVDSVTGARVWDGPTFNGYGWTPPFRPFITADDNLIVGYSSFIWLRDFPQGAETRFFAISPSGAAASIVADNSVLYSSFDLDPDQNICWWSHYASGYYSHSIFPVYTNEVRARATVFDTRFQGLISKTMPAKFATYGRAFIGDPGHTNLLPELNYQPRFANSWVYGVIVDTGHVEWVAESEPTRFFRPISPALSDRFTLFAHGRDSLLRILKGGQIAWTVPTPGSFSVLARTPINRFSHTTATFSNTNELRIGNKVLEASTTEPWGFFDVDGAGAVRTAMRIKANGVLSNDTLISDFRWPWEVPLDFSFDSPGIYRTLMRLSTNAVLGDVHITSPTNQYYLVRFEVPQPDPHTPAGPSVTQTLSRSESITLNASPNLPGMVLYQWLRDGHPISSATDHDLAISSFTFADAGRYSVAIRNAHGSATNEIATLHYDGPPDLAIDRPTANELLLRWPLSASNSRVEHTPELSQPFIPLTTTITTNAALGRAEIRLTTSAAQSFFRLLTF